jgi:transcription elongation factor Elf1
MEPLNTFRCTKVSADSAFTCIFCHHDKSVTVNLDRKDGLAKLVCRVCDQRYQSKVNRTPITTLLFFFLGADCKKYLCADLTEAIDIYSEWIDAADAAQREQTVRRPAASSSRPIPSTQSIGSDDD